MKILPGRAYNDTTYQKKVLKIYNTGTDTRGYKLWSILFFLMLSVSSLIGFSHIHNAQGKFYAYMVSTPNKSDQSFYIKTLDGLKQEKFLFSKFYEDGRDIDAFYDGHVSVRPLRLFQPGIQFLAISGWGLADYRTLAVVSYQSGRFSLIPKFNEYGQLEKNFSADDLQITAAGKGVDNEIVETNFLYYDNGQVQYWKSFYIYDKNLNAYKIAYKTKENGITGEEIEVRTF